MSQRSGQMPTLSMVSLCRIGLVYGIDLLLSIGEGTAARQQDVLDEVKEFPWLPAVDQSISLIASTHRTHSFFSRPAQVDALAQETS